MKRLVLICAFTLSSIAQANIQDSSAATYGASLVTMLVTYFPSLTSNCGGTNQCHTWKMIVEAQEDAALFLATEGQIQGVKLTQAIEALRQLPEAEGASDMDLAQTILSIQ